MITFMIYELTRTTPCQKRQKKEREEKENFGIKRDFMKI